MANNAIYFKSDIICLIMKVNVVLFDWNISNTALYFIQFRSDILIFYCNQILLISFIINWTVHISLFSTRK